jgi:hypothetical protein
MDARERAMINASANILTEFMTFFNPFVCYIRTGNYTVEELVEHFVANNATLQERYTEEARIRIFDRFCIIGDSIILNDLS